MSLIVHGFDDVPLTANKDHGFCSGSGDNLYAITLFPDSNYWLYKHSSRQSSH